MKLWDAVIVGAGPAGCAAAYDLAAAGRSVLLVDKAEFPRPKACAGGLTMKAVQALRYPIDPVVRHTVREIGLEHASAPAGVLRVRRRRPVCVMTVRAELDAYCLDQTRRRGAEFRRIGPILNLREEEDRVLLFAGGEPVAARLLLGADGVHSRVRTLAGAAPWFRTGFALETDVPYSATGRAFPLVFDFAPVPGGYGWLFPRNDHVNVGLYSAGLSRQNMGGFNSDGLNSGRGASSDAEAAGFSRQALPVTINRAALSAYAAARCGTGEHGPVTGQFLGLGAAGYAPSGSRVLLAGDAAGFVDPLTGEGIYGAIASGQAAAAAMLASLRSEDVEPGSRYAAATARLRADLQVAERAARRFYPEPARGLQWMRMPPLRWAVLHSYSEGASLARLTSGIGLARRLLGGLHP